MNIRTNSLYMALSADQVNQTGEAPSDGSDNGCNFYQGLPVREEVPEEETALVEKFIGALGRYLVNLGKPKEHLSDIECASPEVQGRFSRSFAEGRWEIKKKKAETLRNRAMDGYNWQEDRQRQIFGNKAAVYDNNFTLHDLNESPYRNRIISQKPTG